MIHRDFSEHSTSPRKCIFGCKDKLNLFSFPKDLAILDQSIQFVFPCQQPSYKYVSICSLNFTDNSFIDKVQYNTGFAGRLKLKVKVVPSLKGKGIRQRECSFTGLYHSLPRPFGKPPGIRPIRKYFSQSLRRMLPLGESSTYEIITETPKIKI